MEVMGSKYGLLKNLINRIRINQICFYNREKQSIKKVEKEN